MDKTLTIPLEAVFAGANLLGNIRSLSKEGLRQEGFSILKNAIGQATGIDVSGVRCIFSQKVEVMAV